MRTYNGGCPCRCADALGKLGRKHMIETGLNLAERQPLKEMSMVKDKMLSLTSTLKSKQSEWLAEKLMLRCLR